MGFETAILGSAALGAGAGLFGASEQKSAQGKQQSKLNKTVWDYERAQLGNIEQGVGEQERLTKQANREEVEGGEDAIQRFEGAGSQAIQDQSAQAQGAITSGLSDRGLLGTSVAGNAALGVGRAASRSYITLGEAVSGMRQNLAQRRAAGTNRLGALKGYRAQARNNVLAQSLGILAGYQANQQPVSQTPDFSGLGQGAGFLAGMNYKQPGTV